MFQSSYLILFCAVFLCVQGYEYEVRYLDVKLDQFTYTNNETFKLKYLYNDKHWDKNDLNSPIFFYCGNEGAVEVFTENTGFLWESAERFNALIIFAEHRYYGESLPFGNETMNSIENRGYLSSEQALQDFVDVIEYIQSSTESELDYPAGDYELGKRHPVIAFGGSYGGMLASWFRMKYPHIVQGALAASAPIWAFPNMAPCNYYYRTVTQVFNNTSPNCHNIIKESWKFIEHATENDSGKKWVSDQWKLCSPIKTTTDVSTFKNWIADMYSTLAMVNYPYPNDFLRPVPAHPIKKFCDAIDSSKQSNLLLKLYEASQVYLNYTKKAECFKWSGGSSIDDLGLEGWYLQTCTEMTMPFCSTEEEMFEPYPWDYDGFKDGCVSQFGVSPNPKIAEKLYGGLRIEAASNIIFSNGLLDPWSGAGVLHNVSSTVVSIIIPEGAHHLDLRAANKDDPQSVIEARKYYENTFKKWIKEFELNNQRLKEEFKRYKSQSNHDTNDIWRYLEEMRQPKGKIQTSKKHYVQGVKHPANLGMFYPRKITQGH
uniref:Lysosomal Pro-X carboxypeptidase n=1 Tax=Cacopsylla melanoneura TaxID=428564 RepID=A0A8D8UFM4_9HEMI